MLIGYLIIARCFMKKEITEGYNKYGEHGNLAAIFAASLSSYADVHDVSCLIDTIQQIEVTGIDEVNECVVEVRTQILQALTQRIEIEDKDNHINQQRFFTNAILNTRCRTSSEKKVLSDRFDDQVVKIRAEAVNNLLDIQECLYAHMLLQLEELHDETNPDRQAELKQLLSDIYQQNISTYFAAKVQEICDDSQHDLMNVNQQKLMYLLKTVDVVYDVFPACYNLMLLFSSNALKPIFKKVGPMIDIYDIAFQPIFSEHLLTRQQILDLGRDACLAGISHVREGVRSHII